MGVQDQTGWRGVVRRKKDISPVFTQFTFTSQKHEVLI